MPILLEALQAFAQELTTNFAAGVAVPAQPEDQLKGPMQQLLRRAGEEFDLEVVPRVEALTDLAVRPDLGVSVEKVAAGHIELKAPDKGARAEAFTDAHDRQQFKKLKDHPNLIYTDGNEWALYRHGERVGPVVRTEGDVRTDGANAFAEASALAIEKLLRDFLLWEPLVPTSPKALAEMLAPLTRLLRENVVGALSIPGSALKQLADEWRDYFFPEADDQQFADAYAQTLTYALLLARVEGEDDLKDHAADRLDARHGLLAQVLRVLAEPQAREEVDVPVDLLERVIAAVQPEELSRRAKGGDLWLYFYEDFLAAYDPKLRRQRGVYFTPVPVVQAQVALVSELLRESFEKPLGFASEGVTVLDPAVGTGTYLLAAFDSGLEAVRAQYGAGDLPARASVMAANFHGFELLIGSYAVAHLRVAQRVLESKGQLPADGVQIYLTDTLESPHAAPPGLAHAPLFHRKLAEENTRARHVKTEVPILVCLGNPPYFRQVIEPGETGVERLGGWVRGEGGEEGILEDFIRDAPGVHVKNLYNLYVYFWRWALWKVFENAPNRGIVSFITASSYLRGPGFAGMRKFMRQTFDELWILDLGGEGRGARLSENVFAIQTPVAIAVGVRYGESDSEKPARVRYSRIDGTREAKYAMLGTIEGFENVAWQDCFTDWTQPFLPETGADYFSWPPLTELFPWQHSGVQFKRTWPISPDRETLLKRWEALIEASPDERPALFRETRDRKVAKRYPALMGEDQRLPAIKTLPADENSPAMVPYRYRTFDRQYCLLDNRLGDFLRPGLWRTTSARQLFMTSLLTGLIGGGPAATLSDGVPDLHHFRGSFGGKDTIPLWRDAQATAPNTPAGLLETIGDALAREIEPEDLFAYCYAVLSAPGYVERFVDELEVPGPHVPITRDAELFTRAVSLGRRLIWLHTYGGRLVPEDSRAGEVPQGQARSIGEVGTKPADYPTTHSYDEERQELHVGSGVFAPVAPDVRGYSVSGLDVIGSWLDYRMRDGAGRQSSELDKIRPDTWPAEFTEELLHLLWVIENTVALTPDLDETLTQIVDSETFTAEDLPTPSKAERRAPD